MDYYFTFLFTKKNYEIKQGLDRKTGERGERKSERDSSHILLPGLLEMLTGFPTVKIGEVLKRAGK